MGHLQVRSVNSIKVRRIARFSTSRTLAKVSGEISLADGCGGSGWPAGTMDFRKGIGAMLATIEAATLKGASGALTADFGAGASPVAFGVEAWGALVGLSSNTLAAALGQGWRHGVVHPPPLCPPQHD